MSNYFHANTPPFFSADFHYFRIAREKWELMLTRLAQMGLNTITVPLIWGFHEVEEGRIDLTGSTHSRRDVARLLDLCSALGFHCLLNVGPHRPDTGILSNGLPHRFSPEAEDYDTMLPAATERWFKAFSKPLVGQQWPAGPIIALQMNQPDPNQSQSYSQQLTEVQWPIWLRKRHKGIDALNAAYGSSYRTVSQVPFPQTRSDDPTPLEQEAKLFLTEVQGNTRSRYAQILAEAGWQLPIYPDARDDDPPSPAIHNHSLLEVDTLAGLDVQNGLLNLQHPIQVDPDPTGIGCEPVWANGAPIRADGSLRRSFWPARKLIWSHTMPQARVEGACLVVSDEAGGLISCGQDTALKHPLAKGTKPVAHRLALAGQLQVDNQLKAARSKLSGLYLTEDNTSQTDLILYVNDPSAPLGSVTASYLHRLLVAQTQTLAHCATLAQKLRKTLSPTPGPDSPPRTAPPAKPASYTLAEARRGLSEADRILRKAIASIGGLEAGFDTILSRGSANLPEPASPPAEITPEIFEGNIKTLLLEAGEGCRTIAGQLEAAVKKLKEQSVPSPALTIEQYQQRYGAAVAVAHSSRVLLLEIIAKLRVEMASEQLPLVAWRVHNQIQELAESLRWGVLRDGRLP